MKIKTYHKNTHVEVQSAQVRIPMSVYPNQGIQVRVPIS